MMETPRVPEDGGESIDLPCGRSVAVRSIDLGMREFECGCGDIHAVVLDVHPPSRFLPESIVAILREAIESADDFDRFGTPHLMGLVLEEFPAEVAQHDATEDGMAGYQLVWITAFDARRLHEIVVELVIELMEHAVSHSDDDGVVAEFEEQLHAFDVGEFVDRYREAREFEDEYDTAP